MAKLRTKGMDYIPDWDTVHKVKGVPVLTKEECSPNAELPQGFEWDMHINIVQAAVRLRIENNGPLIVHRNSGFAVDGHSKRSLHYGWHGDNISRAMDFHLVHQGVIRNVIDQALLSFKYTDQRFRIGLYPFWNRPGLHVDNPRGTDREGGSYYWFQRRDGLYKFYKWGEFYKCIEDCILHMNELKKVA